MKYNNAFDDDNFKTITGRDGNPLRVLKDGGRTRISMTMRDAVVGTGSHDAKPLITDGRTTDPLALQRPGFRIPVVNDRRSVRDAYRRYELGQIRAHRLGDGTQCTECFGSGEDEDGGDCPVCNGTGVMPDQRSRTGNKGDRPDPASDSLDQHRQTMDRLYAERDAELQNAWRTK